MKTKIYFLTAIFSVLTFGFMFIACEQNSEGSIQFTDEELTVSEESETIDALLEDIIQEMEQVTIENEEQLFSTASLKSTEEEPLCPVLTKTMLNDSTRLLTLDYGDSCGFLIRNRFDQVIDTLVKKGIIYFEVCKRFRQTNAYRKISYDNYYVNGYKIEGTHTVTNTGYVADSTQIRFTVILENGKITTPDGQEYTRETNRERFWIAGLDTPFHGDDEYLIWGVVEGINRAGQQYTRTITDSIHISVACKFILSGEIEVQIEGQDPFYINYGDGDCDAAATVSRNGESKEIVLRYRYRNRYRIRKMI
jgi:hypothetical protein